MFLVRTHMGADFCIKYFDKKIQSDTFKKDRNLSKTLGDIMDEPEIEAGEILHPHLKPEITAQQKDENRSAMTRDFEDKRVRADDFSLEILQKEGHGFQEKKVFLTMSPQSCVHPSRPMISMDLEVFYRIVLWGIPMANQKFVLSVPHDTYEIVTKHRNLVKKQKRYLGMIPVRCSSDGEYRIITFQKDSHGWIWLKAVRISEVKAWKHFLFCVIPKGPTVYQV